MKKIQYKTLGYTGVWNPETEEVENVACFAEVERMYSEANEALAKREAYNGEYTIEDDGETDPAGEPTLEERVGSLESDTADLAEALDQILTSGVAS